MRKTKKKKPAVRRARKAQVVAPGRRFVKLTRAHLEMSGRLTDDEDKRYALTALCVRRAGDRVLVEATNGRMAWQYPAEWASADDLPELAGKELADGERVLIDPDTAKQCLRALPKHHPREAYVSAYLAVDGGVGVLYTMQGVSFRLAHHYDADAKWPDFDDMYTHERGSVCIALDASMLCRITTWLSKHAYSGASQCPVVLSFSKGGSVVKVGFDLDRKEGPTGVLMPIRINGDPLGKSMPAWRAAFDVAEKEAQV